MSPEHPEKPSNPADNAGEKPVLGYHGLTPGMLFAGRYRILQHLGTGAMGDVYKADDQEAGEVVALKVLLPRPDQDQAVERLRRELQIVRSLKHPSIVGVHQLASCEGLHYLVMEFLPGQSLRDHLESRGALSPEESVALLAGLLQPLAAAHEAGVVHRDIKPANIFLVPDRDGGSRVVLLDFGLARRTTDATLTATGSILGTVDYLSPEQARGETSVGPASDLYSAGAVLWQMLTGQPLYGDDSAVKVLQAHVASPLPPLLRDDVPGWLRDLAHWLLNKDPADRPGSAQEALRFLSRRVRRPLTDRCLEWAGERLGLLRTPRLRRWVKATVFVSLVAGSLMAAIWIGREARALYDARFQAAYSVIRESSSIQVLNASGQPIPWWQKTLGRIAGARLQNLERPENFAAAMLGRGEEARLGFLACDDSETMACHFYLYEASSGDPVSSLAVPILGEPGEPVEMLQETTGARVPATFRVRQVLPAELDGDGRGDEMIVVVAARKSFASQVLGLDYDGDWQVLIDYWNTGVGDVAVLPDTDGDGLDQILFYGPSNCAQRGILTVLPYEEGRTLRGRSPESANRKTLERLRDYPQVGYSILFPDSGIAERDGQGSVRGVARSVTWNRGEALLTVEVADRALYPGQTRNLMVDYRFDLKAGKVTVDFPAYDLWQSLLAQSAEPGDSGSPWHLPRGSSPEEMGLLLQGRLRQWVVEDGQAGWGPFSFPALKGSLFPSPSSR